MAKLDFSVIFRDVFEGSNGAACINRSKTGFFMVVHVMATTELMVLKQPTLLLSNKSSKMSAAQFSLHFPYETETAAYSFQSPLHFLSLNCTKQL